MRIEYIHHIRCIRRKHWFHSCFRRCLFDPTYASCFALINTNIDQKPFLPCNKKVKKNDGDGPVYHPFEPQTKFAKRSTFVKISDMQFPSPVSPAMDRRSDRCQALIGNPRTKQPALMRFTKWTGRPGICWSSQVLRQVYQQRGELYHHQQKPLSGRQALLIVDKPFDAYCKIAEHFRPFTGASKTISDSATIGERILYLSFRVHRQSCADRKNCVIYPECLIMDHVIIGDPCDHWRWSSRPAPLSAAMHSTIIPKGPRCMV